VEAVLSYTNATKIDIISHSMGVTLARKVVQGGSANDDGEYDLGKSLSDKVDTFLGVCGANWGLTSCYTSDEYPTCDNELGFYPGWSFGPLGLSTFLEDLNSNGGKEGSHVFTMYSLFDDLIGYGDVVWGTFTSTIPNQDGEMQYNNPTYTHLAMRNTSSEQYKIITNHVTGTHQIHEPLVYQKI